MDTTAKYVEMCEKAKEIQLYRTVKKRCEAGDFVYNKDEYIIEVAEARIMLLVEDVWLPRQDQLQEMIKCNDPFTGTDRIDFFLSWVRSENHTVGYKTSILPYDFKSMEQLWLAFVMKERYSKVWSTTKKDWEVK